MSRSDKDNTENRRRKHERHERAKWKHVQRRHAEDDQSNRPTILLNVQPSSRRARSTNAPNSTVTRAAGEFSGWLFLCGG